MPSNSSTRLRRVARSAAAVLLATAAISCDGDGTGADSRTITIGGLFSLTGNWSSLGVTSKAALELGVEDVNAALEQQGLRFRADVRDTKLDPATALAQAQALR